MKTRLVLAGAALAVLIGCFCWSPDGTTAILFGWIFFLVRVLPRIGVDWPSVCVGCAALVLFAAGVHWMGRAWQRSLPIAEGQPAPAWNLRWSLAVVAVVFLLFAAGISMIGATHQVGWLLTADSLFKKTVAYQRSSKENLTYTGIGLFNYVSANGGLMPPGGSFGPQGEMLHSWETHILPYSGFSTWGINLERPWNDSGNQKHFKTVLSLFINPAVDAPSLTDEEGYGLSHYAANSRVLNGNQPRRLREIGNGSANLILIGEITAGPRPWGHPVNWRDPALGIDNRSPRTFGSPNANGASFLMADGSVRFVSDQTSPEVLRALADPNPRDW